MEVNGSRGAIQIKHKKQSSHDSGTFLDWDEAPTHNSNRSETFDNRPVYNSNVTGEFVTVVAVEAKDATEEDGQNNNFVTVLTVNTATSKINDVIDGRDTAVKTVVGNGENLAINENGVRRRPQKHTQVKEYDIESQDQEINEDQFLEREILVYRLPGERLGFGLKFEGGLQTNQKVSRLFVQSCAPDSPASRTKTSWGHFCPGDEIVQINDVRIENLTRIDCVKFLKESTVVLKLLVRHLRLPEDVLDENCEQIINAESSLRADSNISETHKKFQESNGSPKNVNNKENTESDSNSSGANGSSPINGTKFENSSPPPIPPRKLLKKSSSTSVADKRQTSPKAFPRSLVSQSNENIQTGNGGNYVNTETVGVSFSSQQVPKTLETNITGEAKKREEFYEVDLKLSDEDIDEIIESLNKTESEEALRESESGHGNHSPGQSNVDKNNVSVNEKPLLDINDNVQNNGVSHHHSDFLRRDSEVPGAEFYTNLFLDSNDNIFESESDDTGSSHTTAIDRLSLNSSDRISLTSSSSFSDIKSLNSFEFDVESNIETTIDFDKVLEPLEGSAEGLPLESSVPNTGTEALFGTFVLKNVKNEEKRVSQKLEQSDKTVANTGKGAETSHVQDVSKIRSQSDSSAQSPKPLPRTEMQKLKFKSGKKMPPPPPPPVKKVNTVDKSVNVQSFIVKEQISQLEKEDRSVNATTNENVGTEITQSHQKIIKNNKSDVNRCSKSPQNSSESPSKSCNGILFEESTKTSNKRNEDNLFTTVEEIPVVENLLPKVINAQEKVPTGSTSPSPSDLSFLETIVENDEHQKHLPRLIDFVPKEKVKSISPEKSKKLNSIIYEQQKVVEYFTTPHSPNKNQGKGRPYERNEAKTGKTNRSPTSSPTQSSPTQTSPAAQKGHPISDIVDKVQETISTDKMKTEEEKNSINSTLKDTSKDPMNDTDNRIVPVEILDQTDLHGLDKEKEILNSIDRNADGREHVLTGNCGKEREVPQALEHEAAKEVTRRQEKCHNSMQAVSQSELYYTDQPDGSYPAELHVTPSTPPALHDLKLCDGLETNSGSHELPPSEPSSANAMMPAPVALQQTRLPPDGHEFPQTYQELQGPKDFLNYTAKTHTMSPANGLPPLPTSNPPVSRKPSRPNSDVFPRDTSCGRNRKDPTPLRREAFCDNKTDHRYKTAENSPSYKYQNKDEKSERSVRDKIAMFSNKSNSGQSSSNLSPTSAHKFVEPLKRPLTRESSPFGLPPSPTSPFKDALILGKENFKNDDFVSHTFLTNLDVDSTYLQNHFQETSVNCQSESSAYSSLSTSEILYDKNSDCNGSDFVNCNYNKSSPNQENRVNDGKSDVNISDGSTIESTKRYDIITDIYKQKYTTDLSAGRQNDKLRTNFETPKRSLSDAYNKFNSENKSKCSPGGRNNTPRTPEYKINDFSSLPRKLKVLKSQESRESSPDTNEGYTSKLTRAISFHSPPLLHTRSQSMIDINRNNGADSISKLMEKRKKNISKLKGLIIPEKSEISTSSVTICNLPEIKVKTPSSLFGSTELLDNVSQHNERPGIIKTPVPLERTVSNPLDLKQTNGYERKRNNSVDNTIDQVDIGRNLEQHNIRMTSSTWDLNDVPKYSPAFKRKSLTVYDKTKPFANQLVSNSVKKVSPPKPPRKSYEGKINNEQIDAIISFDKIKENCNSRKITTKLSSSEGECTDKVSAAPVSRRSVDTLHCSPDDKHSIVTSSSPEKINNKNDRLNPNDRLGVKKLNILTAYNTESSESDDNDSAISSNLSPPLSPLKHDEIDGRNQQRKISTNSSSSSTLTSGDDSIYYPAGDTKRILKPQSVEAVNRKNVLSSAKFRSGDKTNELILKENEPIHEDLARCVDNRLKSAKLDNSESLRKNDEDEYSSSTLNDNEEEDFEFNDECTDKIYSRRLSNIKIAYLDVQVDSAESSDDILSSSDRISEGANSDDEMSVTSSESKLVNGRAVDDWGNTPDEICSKIEEYIDDLEIYSQEIEEKRNKLINERTRRVRRTQESVKIDKFVRTNEFLRNAKMNEANEKLSHTSENKILKEREIVRSPSRNRLDRLKKDIVEPETTETEASIDEVVPKPSLKPSILIKPRLEKASKLDEIKSEYLRSVSKNETVKLSESTTPLSRKTSGLSVARKLTDYSKANVTPLLDCPKPVSSMVDNSKPTMLPAQISRLPSSQHMRVSSLDSTTSDDSFTMQREQFGSITSIASSTSLISQQELQQLIDESNHCLDESNGAGLIPGTSEVSVVVLHRDLPGNSVGITLAGGSDYESKEITVHKVISGTPADRDGRLQKGDRILSINGKSMKGLTHKESLAILKAPRSEVVLVVSRWKPSDTGDSSVSLSPNVTTLSSSLSPSQLTNTLGVSILGSPNSSNTSMTSQNSPLSPVTLSLNSSPSKTTAVRSMVATGLDRSPVQSGDDSSVSRGAPVDVTLIKDGAGLGFSLEGGKDSPFGDQPLTIKKIFTGGCAEKNGQLKAGDEILAINHMPVADLSRIDAWSLLKKLNDGSVLLTLRHKV